MSQRAPLFILRRTKDVHGEAEVAARQRQKAYGGGAHCRKSLSSWRRRCTAKGAATDYQRFKRCGVGFCLEAVAFGARRKIGGKGGATGIGRGATEKTVNLRCRFSAYVAYRGCPQVSLSLGLRQGAYCLRRHLRRLSLCKFRRRAGCVAGKRSVGSRSVAAGRSLTQSAAISDFATAAHFLVLRSLAGVGLHPRNIAWAFDVGAPLRTY